MEVRLVASSTSDNPEVMLSPKGIRLESLTSKKKIYPMQMNRMSSPNHTPWHLDLHAHAPGNGENTAIGHEVVCIRSTQDLEEYRDGRWCKAGPVDEEEAITLR